ncbi:MAG: hypothetical protein FK734_05155 [Asgard group archaeon]|nr:hypothetical protein [Asgard group archaeon]
MNFYSQKLPKRTRRQLVRKIRKMSNDDLKKSLIEIRSKNEVIDIDNIEKLEKEFIGNLVLEELYSTELKKRELLEWALQSN